MLLSVKVIGAGLSTIGLWGAGIGIGIVFSVLIKSILRTSSVKADLFTYAVRGFAWTKATGLFSFMLRFFLLWDKRRGLGKLEGNGNKKGWGVIIIMVTLLLLWTMGINEVLLESMILGDNDYYKESLSMGWGWLFMGKGEKRIKWTDIVNLSIKVKEKMAEIMIDIIGMILLGIVICMLSYFKDILKISGIKLLCVLMVILWVFMWPYIKTSELGLEMLIKRMRRRGETDTEDYDEVKNLIKGWENLGERMWKYLGEEKKTIKGIIDMYRVDRWYDGIRPRGWDEFIDMFKNIKSNWVVVILLIWLKELKRLYKEKPDIISRDFYEVILILLILLLFVKFIDWIVCTINMIIKSKRYKERKIGMRGIYSLGGKISYIKIFIIGCASLIGMVILILLLIKEGSVDIEISDVVMSGFVILGGKRKKDVRIWRCREKLKKGS